MTVAVKYTGKTNKAKLELLPYTSEVISTAKKYGNINVVASSKEDNYNHIPVLVFALKDPENILRAVMGEKIGTDLHR